MKKESSSFSGLNLAEVLLVVFVILKLCKVINWSWWWVLSPLWISIILVIIVSTIYYIADKRAFSRKFGKNK